MNRCLSCRSIIKITEFRWRGHAPLSEREGPRGWKRLSMSFSYMNANVCNFARVEEGEN